MKNLSLKWFLHHFVNDQREDKKFCFILGAGASRSSGIRTGGELANLWVKELYEMEDKVTIDKWLEEEKILLDDLAQGYSKIYDKRFIDPRDGFDFLEKEMERKEPSCGYSVLANILSTTQHKMVITTNFDSLCEDALFIYSQKKPLIVGHEALANFIRPFSGRPAVVKIHRDLFLSPMNKNNDTCILADNFKKSLRDVFKFYTPLVVGYGGNDGSLMNYLLELDSIDGGMFWFHIGDDLSENVKKVIEKFNGRSVKIDGFDDFMIQLGDKLGYSPMDTKILEYANSRAEKYREQFDKIKKRFDLPSETKTALSSIDKRTVNKNWWYFQKIIDEENDIKKQNELYKKYISENPKYYQLVGNYALFLHDICEDYNEAEKHYIRAIELNANHINTIGNYANFLNTIRKNFDEAEKYYKRAIKLVPSDANTIGNYALFLHTIRKNYDEAEKYYKRAIEITPNDPHLLGCYALFLHTIRKDYVEAEKYYKKTLELNLLDANDLSNYALLNIELHRFDEAQKLIASAFQIVKEKVHKTAKLELWFYRYAVFWKDCPEAKENVTKLLAESLRSPGWNLDEIVKISEELKHPEIEEVKRLAKLISEEK